METKDEHSKTLIETGADMELKQHISISPGSRLTSHDGSIDLRVLCLNETMSVVCDLNKKELDVHFEPSDRLIRMVRDDDLEVINDNYILDKDSLPETVLSQLERNKEIVKMVSEEYGPDYMGLCGKTSKPIVKRVVEEFGISKATFWRLVNQYIRSGLKEYSLINQRYVKTVKKEEYNYKSKTGRPSKYKEDGKILDDRDRSNFDRYVKRYISSPNAKFSDLYVDMIDECYSADIMQEDGSLLHINYDPDKRPSYNQFHYYASKKITPQQKKRAKMGSDQYRNDARVLTGSAMDGIMGPADCVEIDAHEMDVSLVSREYPESCVGRPILYLIIDVFTRIILGVSIAMDNNSVVGITNVFYNLIEDKGQLLEQYGCSYQGTGEYTIDDIWPSRVKPNRIRVDHGSDFISDQFDRILKELNIGMDLVPPATGSMKGIVERIFADIEKQTKDLLEKKGGIDPKHRSKHHKQATLDIDDATKIILNYVLYHNTYYMKSYEKSADMLKKRIRPIPCELWRYGCKTLKPRQMPPDDEYIFSLLIPAAASYSRAGIHFEGLRYINVSDSELMQKMSSTQNTKKDIRVRYDPRDMGHIYYLKDNTLQTAELLPNPNWAGYVGMSYGHYMKLREDEKQMDAEGEEMNLHNKTALRHTDKDVIKTAKKNSSGNVDTKNMRENRAIEKEAVSAEHSIAAKTGNMSPSDEMKRQIAQKVEQKAQSSEQKVSGSEESTATVHYEQGDTQEDILRKQMELSMQMFEDDD